MGLQQDPETGTGAPAASTQPQKRLGKIAYFIDIMGKRRQFIVHRKSQLRASFMTSAVVLVLLVLLNLSLHSARARSAAAVLQDAPELADMVAAQNRFEFLLGVIASGVFLAGVFVVTVLETHKTAGAALNIARHLDQVKNGNYAVRLRLRKDDNLQIVQEAFNDMTCALQDRAWTEAEILEELSSEIAGVSTPVEAESIAGKLREQSAWKRHMSG